MIDPLMVAGPAARATIGCGLGLVIGSFLAVIALRWPRGEGVTQGRSRCDRCRRALSAMELLPVIGFLIARGRCRGCGGAIDRRHPAIELGAAAVGATTLAAAPGWPGIAGAAFGWALLLLAILDAEHYWLPDRLTLPLLGLGMAASALAEPALADRAIGAAAGYAVLMLIRVGYARLRGRQGLGGGDPKLFAAIGGWLGWQALPFVALAASGLGLALVVAARMAGRSVSLADRLPFGALLAVAGFGCWLFAALGGSTP